MLPLFDNENSQIKIEESITKSYCNRGGKEMQIVIYSMVIEKKARNDIKQREVIFNLQSR